MNPSGLNPQQEEAVLHTEGPLIVLAGAGSGKTKMLTSRIAHLIQGKGVNPSSVLAVTFTNKAAGEMRERVERTLSVPEGSFRAPPVWMTAPRNPFSAPEIGTFHSICMRILRREHAHTPFAKPFVIYDDSDQLNLVKAVLKKLNIDEKAISPKSIQSAINRLKCDAVEPSELEPRAHQIFEKKLKEAYAAYQEELFQNSALDFGEILTMTYRILRDHPEVRAKYQLRYQYIHVDEYQDTNRAQYLLLGILADPRHGGHGNLCVVGDEDQSIYKWRGADIHNILNFEEDYPGAHVIKLEQNYRSTKTILKAASFVIRNNTQRKDKTLWTENEAGAKLVRAQLADERAEAEFVTREIRRLASEDGRSFDEFAVFYRTNAQSRPFEDVLRREKITYEVVGGLRFYDRKEIKDVLAYFKVIQNPADSINLKRVLNVPARGIGKTTVDKIEEHAMQNGRTFWDALQSDGVQGLGAGTRKKLDGFVELVAALQAEQPKLTLAELYHRVLDVTGYVNALKDENTDESLARVENLEELDNVIQEFEEDQFERTTDREAAKPHLLPLFLEQTSLISEIEAREAGAKNIPSLKLMTLHSSKGLEFPIVFLVGMEEGLFPSVRSWEESEDEEIEEERRLCYVGMTRARQKLYMSHVQMRRNWGEVTMQDPSRFFTEMPDDCVDVIDLSYGQARNGFRSGSAFPGGRTRDPLWIGPATGARPSLDWSSGGREHELVGAGIEHPDYGQGKIVEVEGSGQDQKVLIDFASKSVGRKKFLYRYVAGFRV